MIMEENNRRELNFYNRLYSRYVPFTKKNVCGNNSIIDLEYANCMVNKICKAFRLPSMLYNKKILDVGCGLGFMSEAFRLRGAEVTALDFSEEAIKQIKSIFPYLNAIVGCFPDVLSIKSQKFDIIFERDLTILSTMDLENLCDKFFYPALEMLTDNGLIICGSRSNFSGLVDAGNWANWPYAFFKEFKKRFSILGPKVVNYNLPLHPMFAYLCKKRNLKIPFYFIIKKRLIKDAKLYI